MPQGTNKGTSRIFTRRNSGCPLIFADGDRYLRITSLDKKFIIAYPMGTEPETPAVVEVIGSEFPGVESAEGRPLWFVAD
jgi:hypothetical protein